MDFEYKVKISGDTSNLDAVLKRANGQMQKLENDEVLIKLAYDGNYSDFYKIIKQITKDAPEIGVKFQYDLNKKALEQEQKKLEKMKAFSSSESLYNTFVEKWDNFRSNVKGMSQNDIINDKNLENSRRELSEIIYLLGQVDLDAYNSIGRPILDYVESFKEFKDVNINIIKKEDIEKQENLVKEIENNISNLKAEMSEIPETKEVKVVLDTSEFDSKYLDVKNKLDSLDSKKKIKIETEYEDSGDKLSSIVKGWSDAVKISGRFSNERYAFANSTNGFVTNSNLLSNPTGVSESDIRNLQKKVIDDYSEVVDTFIHSHPNNVAAFSNSDIKSAFTLLEDGIKKQIVASTEEIMEIDYSKVDTTKSNDIINEIENRYAEADEDFKNNIYENIKKNASEIFGNIIDNANNSLLDNTFNEPIGYNLEIAKLFKSKLPEFINDLNIEELSLDDFNFEVSEFLYRIIQDYTKEYSKKLKENDKLGRDELTTNTTNLLHTFEDSISDYVKSAGGDEIQKVYQSILKDVFSNKKYLNSGEASAISVSSIDDFKFFKNDISDINDNDIEINIHPGNLDEFISEIKNKVSENPIDVKINPVIDDSGETSSLSNTTPSQIEKQADAHIDNANAIVEEIENQKKLNQVQNDETTLLSGDISINQENSKLEETILDYENIVELVKEYFELRNKISSVKNISPILSEEEERIFLYNRNKNTIGIPDDYKRRSDVHDVYRKYVKQYNSGNEFAEKSIRAAIKNYWNNIESVPNDNELLSNTQQIFGNKTNKEEYVIPRKYEELEREIINEILSVKENNKALTEENNIINETNSKYRERLSDITKIIKSNVNPEYDGDYSIGLSLKGLSLKNSKKNILSTNSSLTEQQVIEELCRMIGIDIPQAEEKASNASKESANSQIADINRIKEAKKELESQPNESDISTDTSSINAEAEACENLAKAEKEEKAIHYSSTTPMTDEENASVLREMAEAQSKLNSEKKEATTVDSGEAESSSMSDLEQTVKNVTKAVEEKTTAFRTEGTTVGEVLKVEIENLQRLIVKLENVKSLLTDVSGIKIDTTNIKPANSGSASNATSTNKTKDKTDDDYIKDALSKVAQIKKLKESVAKANVSKNEKLIDPSDIANIDKYTTELNELLSKISSGVDTSKITNAIAEMELSIDSIGQNAISKLDESFKKLASKRNLTPEFVEQIREAKESLSELPDIDWVDPQDVKQFREIFDLLKQLENESKLAINVQGSMKKLSGIYANISSFIEKNTNMTSEELAEARALQSTAQEFLNTEKATASQVEQLEISFNKLKGSVSEAGNTGKNMIDQIANRVGDMNSKFIAQFLSWQDWIRYARQALDTVKEIDSAITELRKVSNASENRLTQSFENSAITAKKLGSSITDVINSTADWARLGYNVDAAEELARVTTLYQNVGDNITQEAASESLISTLQGFELAADESERIIDKFNEVANNYAIDSAGIGEALKRSAASFNAANTDLSESIALVTATNAVVQDPDSVGTMWKTVSARIRGADTELKELGEDSDEYVESTSKLRDLVKGMTGFDIMEDEDTYKSIYDIMIGIGKEWKNLSDIDQAALLEALAGKRAGNALAAALNNVDMIEDAYETAENSAGSAMKEQENYEKSIQYSLDRLKASAQEWSADLFNSDVIKFFVDLGNAIINVSDAITPLGTLAIGGGIFAGLKNVGRNKMLFLYI